MNYGPVLQVSELRTLVEAAGLVLSAEPLAECDCKGTSAYVMSRPGEEHLTEAEGAPHWCFPVAYDRVSGQEVGVYVLKREQAILRKRAAKRVLHDVAAEPLRQREDAGVAAEQVEPLEADPYLTAAAPPRWWQRS